MSTKTAALPVERSYLLRAWLIVAAIVIVAASLISLAMANRDGSTSGIARKPATGTIVDYGPPTVAHGPFIINGVVCGQCR